MADLPDLIKQHNALVRTNSKDRWCYREVCANCESNDEKDPFAPHELRRRSLRYVVANSVHCVVIWLARWRCRNCGKTFTDYPDFRLAL